MQNGKDGLKEALDKKAAYGPDIDLDHYELGSFEPHEIDDLEKADEATRAIMDDIGVVSNEEGRDGTIMFIDNAMSHCNNKAEEGVEVMSTKEALAKYDWVRDYYWNAVKPDKDKYTAKTCLEDGDGYFIYVKPGYKVKNPVQTCMMIDSKKSIQTLHNIVIVDKDASLEIITGCATGNHVNDALHVGVSEIYVKEGGSVVFSMIHNWGTQTAVRPRTACIVEKGGRYVNNYVLLKPVGTLQSYPACYLNGEGATCKMNTICIANEGSDVDMGGSVILNAPNTSAEIISRNIVHGGKIKARGRLEGHAPGVKAHLECRSIMLSDGGSTDAIPELESTVADVEMTHEAAVGKIARDQIEYLMSRGLSEDDAVSMIVRGFLVGGINGLPDHLRNEIDAAVTKANVGN